MKPLHELLEVDRATYDALVEKVPAALLKAIKEQETPNEIKAAVVASILNSVRIGEGLHTTGMDACILIGIMVEQAYNAAVLQSQQKKPLFGKRK